LTSALCGMRANQITSERKGERKSWDKEWKKIVRKIIREKRCRKGIEKKDSRITGGPSEEGRVRDEGKRGYGAAKIKKASD